MVDLRKIAYFLLISLFVFSCKKGVIETNSKTSILNERSLEDEEKYYLKKKIKAQGGESFENFISKFITDSIFRYSRIKFPINGFNSEEKQQGVYTWNKEDFYFYFSETLQRIEDPYFKKEISEIDQNKKSLRLYVENSGFDTKCKFKLIDGEWLLDSYSYSNQ